MLILTYVLCTITLAFLLHFILNYIPMQLILQLIVHGFMFELLVTSENGEFIVHRVVISIPTHT